MRDRRITDYFKCSKAFFIEYLAYLFKNCNIPASALEFELAPLADNVIEEEESEI